MKSLPELPDGYREFFRVDLQKDKKIAIFVNLLAILIGVVMCVPVHLVISLATLFDLSRGFLPLLLRMIVLLVGLVLYMILHELVHGITMKLFGTKKVKYGFTGLYAFAGSDDYYSKIPYIVVALAPVIVWGIVLGILCPLVPRDWFWVVYFLQISNISGAAGDFYVTCRFFGMPRDILIHDSGVGMTVYSKQTPPSKTEATED